MSSFRAQFFYRSSMLIYINSIVVDKILVRLSDSKKLDKSEDRELQKDPV